MKKGQLKAKELFINFLSHFRLLVIHASLDMTKKIEKAQKKITNLIEQNDAPSSTESGKEIIREQVQIHREFLELLRNADTINIVIPDTNALLQFPNPIAYGTITNSKKYQFVILPTVLSELDKLKISHRSDSLRDKAKSVVK